MEGRMAEADTAGICPQVFVVDSQAPVVRVPTAVPSRLGKTPLHTLYLLVSLVMLAIMIEACFIYQLYHRTPETQASPDTHGTAQMIGEKKQDGSDDSNEIPLLLSKTTDNLKPAAFLQGMNPVARADGVMWWQTVGLSPFVRGLRYADGYLHVQTEGYYYVYSKVYFTESCFLFKHQVMRRSPRYYVPTSLMQSFRYSCLESERMEREDVSNSYLGGVFHLYQDDSVYVEVNNSSLLRVGVYDNFFGVFML